MSKKTNKLKAKVKELEGKITTLENLIMYIKQRGRPNQFVSYFSKDVPHPISFEFLQEYFAGIFFEELKKHIEIKDCGNFYRGYLIIDPQKGLSRGKKAVMMEADGVDLLKNNKII